MDNTGDIVVIVIVVGFLAIGLISMLIGQLVRLWDWLLDLRPAPVTSSRATVPTAPENNREQRSHAMEQGGNTKAGTRSQLIATLGNMTDEELLDILARVTDEDGEYRFADSRVAKFIGGRVQDRVDQVRQARGLVDAGPYRTPIAERPTNANF